MCYYLKVVSISKNLNNFPIIPNNMIYSRELRATFPNATPVTVNGIFDGIRRFSPEERDDGALDDICLVGAIIHVSETLPPPGRLPAAWNRARRFFNQNAPSGRVLTAHITDPAEKNNPRAPYLLWQHPLPLSRGYLGRLLEGASPRGSGLISLRGSVMVPDMPSTVDSLCFGSIFPIVEIFHDSYEYELPATLPQAGNATPWGAQPVGYLYY